MKPSATAKSNISKPSDTIHAAVLEERRRISRELHDRVLQLLATARLRVERCGQQLVAGPDGLKSELKSVEASLDRAVTEIRNLLSENQLDEQLQAGSLERRLRD